MEKPIKIILAALFFLCLAKMPYGYYTFVRLVATIGFCVLAYKSMEKENSTQLIVYVCLAILFQPIFKIALGREPWSIVDVIVGIGLLLSLFQKDSEVKS